MSDVSKVRTGRPPRLNHADDKFWLKVKCGAKNECWDWQGYKGPSGHGRTTLMGVSTLASKKAWVLARGRILEGLCVNHKCDNPLCCNPNHMYLGTRADNMTDRWRETPSHERKARYSPGTTFTQDELTRLYEMRRNGATMKECAAKFGVHIATVYRQITSQRKARLAAMRQRVQKMRTDVQA